MKTKAAKPGTHTIGGRVRTIRLHMKMKQADFAGQLKLSIPGLSEIENGKYKPGHDFFYHMADVFNVNLYYLLFGEGPMFIEKDGRPGSNGFHKGEFESEVKEFLYYFNRSDIVKHNTLGQFKVFLVQSADVIRKEIEQKEEGRNGNNGGNNGK